MRLEQHDEHTQAPPRWERAFADLLRWAIGRVQLIARTTPVNVASELASLERDWARGDERLGRFEHAPSPVDRQVLEALTEAADSATNRSALATIYAARARELALEVRMCAAAGSPELFALARRRFSARDRFDHEADELAHRWLTDWSGAPYCGARFPAGPHPGHCGARFPAGTEVVSDDERDPRSLVCRLRDEIGRRRLPFRVLSSGRMCALAATGASVIYVARGKRLGIVDVERIVMHEIEGHALPRARAARRPLGIFRVGTSRGSDEQEGRALAIERTMGMLLPARRRELARRHHAARLVERGADFVETARALRNHGTPTHDALRITTRAHRGGGLAREVVYLPALLRVEDARRTNPSIDRALAAGQVAVDVAATLAAWA